MKSKKSAYKKRKVDDLAEKSASWLGKNYTMMKKQKIRSWKAIMIIAFFAGAIAGLAWVYSNTKDDSATQSTITRPQQAKSHAATSGTVSFSGYTWTVRDSAGALAGPGQNRFSGSPQNVWVDSLGQLHLKITNVNGVWYSSEVYLPQSLGYGTYKYVVTSPVDQYDRNIVTGLFNYENDTREVDIEFSRWGSTTYPDGQYTVQPGSVAGNSKTFLPNVSGNPSTHSYTWTPSQITFQSWLGTSLTPPSSLISSWTYTGSSNPPAGAERTHINFWLSDVTRDGIGDAPTNGQEAELIIQKFEFTPYKTGVADTTAPTVAITSPLDGASIIKTLKVVASSTDNVGVVKMRALLDTTQVCTSTTPTLACSFATRKYSLGAHTLTAEATDAAGNKGTKTINVILK